MRTSLGVEKKWALLPWIVDFVKGLLCVKKTISGRMLDKCYIIYTRCTYYLYKKNGVIFGLIYSGKWVRVGSPNVTTSHK